MVKMIWGSQRATFDVSERLIEEAVSRSKAPLEMLKLLISNSVFEAPVTEVLVYAAAGNRKHESSLIPYLSQLQEHPIPITENILVTAMQSGPSVIEMLMEKSPGVPITDRFFWRLIHIPTYCPYF
jgi:hypothetical protein